MLGAFQGKLNPVSSRAIYETCVVPILLYECENWILTPSIIDQLEVFQAEMGRRILKLSKFHSALSTHLALQWPSVSARVLILKFSKVSSDEDAVGYRIYANLATKDHQSLRIVQECQSLEGILECSGVTICVEV